MRNCEIALRPLIKNIKKASTDVSRNKIRPIKNVIKSITIVPANEKSVINVLLIYSPHTPDLNTPSREIRIKILPMVMFGFINLNFLELKK